MLILERYLMGLAVAHGLWLYFFTTGQLLRPNVPDESTSFSLSDLVVTSVAGMALSGFGLLLLGFAHLLNLFGISIALVVEGVLFWLLKGDNPLALIFWQSAVRRFAKAWTVPAFLCYFVFLALGLPAVLPPTFADSVTYHLPYAVDWANAGRIYVDSFLRFPYYANNFLLLYSALFVLKLGGYCHFLTWLCGLITCLGVLAFFADTDVEGPRAAPPQRWSLQPHQFLIPLSVALSPVFLRYLNVGMLDVPIGLFVLVPILCAYRTLSGQALQWDLVVTAAFCAGMKLTLIGHLPFFLISLIFVSTHRLARRQIVVLSLVLIALSLPWYMRNFIDCRDPIPPVLNFYFNHPDPIFTSTRADNQLYTAGVILERQPLQLLLQPFRFFTHPESPHFLEIGANAMILLLYGPALFLFGVPYLRKRCPSSEGVNYVSASVVYLTFPWLFSSAGRHSLHWFPVLAAWVGIVIAHFYAWALTTWHSPWQKRLTRLVTTVFCCSLLFPTPSRGSMRFYQDYYGTIASLFRSGDDLQDYLQKHLNGYSAGQAVTATLVSNQKSNTKVLLFPEVGGLTYYFREAKIISVGDYFGPASYVDLARNILDGNCLPYLSRLDISAIIIQPSLWPSFYDIFQAQLEDRGFREFGYSKDNVSIFLRSDINPNAELIPVK
jgi:hypothetical protein